MHFFILIQVNFGRKVRLNHIVTKGSPANYGEPRRVVTYTLEFYTNKKWKKYLIDNSVKVIFLKIIKIRACLSLS